MIPVLIQPKERLLHDVLRGRRVPKHDNGEADQAHGVLSVEGRHSVFGGGRLGVHSVCCCVTRAEPVRPCPSPGLRTRRVRGISLHVSETPSGLISCRPERVGCPIVSVILVALFLGAAGVANMMVICLLERRSEIGPRRTLRRHQRQQPLTSPPTPSCECPWLPPSQAARSPSRSIEPPGPAPPTHWPDHLTRNEQPAKAHQLRQPAAA